MAPLQANRDWRLLLTIALLLSSTLGLQALSHGSPTVLRQKLDTFPQQVGAWNSVDVAIDQDVQEVLGASDLLNRVYFDPQNKISIGLFVGYFGSQQRGGAIHSPKNCLPGAGWTALEGGLATIAVPGYPEPVNVNRYIIQKGMNKQLVLYWYQSQGRVIASEYAAKVYLVWDAATKNRTDGALVRFITPIVGGDEAAALERATGFVQETFPYLTEYIPS